MESEKGTWKPITEVPVDELTPEEAQKAVAFLRKLGEKEEVK